MNTLPTSHKRNIRATPVAGDLVTRADRALREGRYADAQADLEVLLGIADPLPVARPAVNLLRRWTARDFGMAVVDATECRRRRRLLPTVRTDAQLAAVHRLAGGSR